MLRCRSYPGPKPALPSSRTTVIQASSQSSLASETGSRELWGAQAGSPCKHNIGENLFPADRFSSELQVSSASSWVFLLSKEASDMSFPAAFEPRVSSFLIVWVVPALQESWAQNWWTACWLLCVYFLKDTHDVQLMSNWCHFCVEHNISLQVAGLLKIILSRAFKSFYIFSDKGSCLMEFIFMALKPPV